MSSESLFGGWPDGTLHRTAGRGSWAAKANPGLAGLLMLKATGTNNINKLKI